MLFYIDVIESVQQPIISNILDVVIKFCWTVTRQNFPTLLIINVLLAAIATEMRRAHYVRYVHFIVSYFHFISRLYVGVTFNCPHIAIKRRCFCVNGCD